MIQLTFTDHRPEVLQLWQLAVGRETSATFRIRQAGEDILNTSNSDALAMPTVIAHQLYGGLPVIGRSQVLKVPERTEVGRSRWIVTTIPFPAELKLVAMHDGEQAWRVTPVVDMSRARETFLLFKGMMQAIESHNDLYSSKQICSFAVDLAFIGITQLREEANAALTAIVARQQSEFLEDEVEDASDTSWMWETAVARREGALKQQFSFNLNMYPQERNLINHPLIGIRNIYLTKKVRNKIAERSTPFGEVLETILQGNLEPSSWPGLGLEDRRVVIHVVTRSSERFRVAAIISFRWRRISVHDIEPESRDSTGLNQLMLPNP